MCACSEPSPVPLRWVLLFSLLTDEETEAHPHRAVRFQAELSASEDGPGIMGQTAGHMPGFQHGPQWEMLLVREDFWTQGWGAGEGREGMVGPPRRA